VSRSIKGRLAADLVSAMKARDTATVSCIRMLKSKLLEREVALRGKHGTGYEIDDPEALAVVTGYAKQRRDSIESFRQGGRDDLVAAELAELAIVLRYLPQELGEDELRQLIRRAIEAAGARSTKDLGPVMKAVMSETRGRADGGRVQRLVREVLEQSGAGQL
jgi:uncharacterized protein YqeY